MENITIFLAVIAFSITLGAIAVWRKIPIMMFIMGAIITFFALQSDTIIQGYYDPLVTIHNHTTMIPTSTTRYQMGHSFSDSNDGNPLQEFNSPVFTTWTDPDPVFTELDTYVEFNGSTNYAQAIASTTIDITTQDFSFMGLLYRDTDSGSTEFIISKSDTAVNTGYALFITSGDQLAFRFGDGTSVTITLTSTTVGVDKWYAWGFSADRNNVGTLYLFDISSEQLYSRIVDISLRSGTITNTQKVTLGKVANAATNYCDCWMDEVRYYDSHVLSGEEFHDIIHTGFTDSDFTEIHHHNSVPESIDETLPIWTRIIIMLTGSMFMITGALIWKSREETEPQ